MLKNCNNLSVSLKFKNVYPAPPLTGWRTHSQLNSRANSDLVVRYGGEEFLIVLQEASILAASKVAETLLGEIRRLAIPHEGRNDSKQILTLSIGVACQRSGEPLPPDFLLKRADDALYKAKSSGRDCYMLSDLSFSAHIPESVSATE